MLHSWTKFPTRVAIKRIIPVSSGKGGVGKTTFAINFSLALSQHGRTVLVDLDTGTSAIRNAIDVPIAKDLYHFFRRGEPLDACVTRLDDKMDRQGRYRNFGFIAGPMHLIDEITNFGANHKARLINALNSLDADYVILDMRAGLDSNVIDFLPFSNSGILIFTPHLPSATLAASDIVKAILFRKLRLIFSKESPFFETVGGRLDFWRLINELIDRVEDVYDSSVQNLDAFALDLAQNLGDHPITRTVQQTTAAPASPSDPGDHLSNQLTVLRAMFEQKKNDDYHANFDYVSQRALFTMKNRRPSEFGDTRIYAPSEMLSSLFAKSNVPTTMD